MADRPFTDVLRHLRRLARPPGSAELGDGQLLDRFARQRDEAAFETLLERHGPMVLGVCRRVLRDSQDADDAFQATFLVLVRKAKSLSHGERVGNWLYGVAYRTAVRARVQAGKRAARELLPENEPIIVRRDEAEWRDLCAVLDEELQRLPEKYRVPLVLCYLQGKSHEEAARQLSCPKGTVETRLARGRERLRQRLFRRGLALSTAALAVALSSQILNAAVPAALAEATLRAALLFATGGVAVGAITSPVAILAEGVLKTMFLTKLKIAAALFLTLGVAGSGAGLFTYNALGTEQGPEKQSAEKTKDPGQATKQPAKAAAPANPVTEATAPPQVRDERTLVIRLRDKLNSPVPMFGGFDDPKTSLQEAIQHLTDRYDMVFDVDEAAFKALQVADVQSIAIAEKPIPQMRNVRMTAILDKILERVPVEEGATYLLRRDGVVLITTKSAVRAITGVSKERTLFPLVQLVARRQPLEDVLEELSESAGANVVLDNRVGEKAKQPITARLTNVPLDNAVRLLADMSELKAVQVGNVIYVTTKDNAAEWEAEQKAEVETDKKKPVPSADKKSAM